MEVVSVKVDRAVKDKMKKLPNVNWSEIIRRALAEKIREEESKARTADRQSLLEASRMTDRIRKSSGRWNSTEEIRKWRQARK